MVAKDVAAHPREGVDNNAPVEQQRRAELSASTWQGMQSEPRPNKPDGQTKTPGYELHAMALDFAPGKNSQADLQQKVMDGTARPEERIQAVRELVKQGVTSIKAVDGKGHDANLRMEVHGAGDKEMVHLFVNQNGKEKTALRGLVAGDKVEQQRDHKGHNVSYEGKGSAALKQMHGAEAGAPPDAGDARPAQPAAEARIAQRPAPKPEAPAPKHEAPAPKPEAPAPKPEAPAPKPEAPAPKPEAPAPKPEAPAPKTEAPVRPETPIKPGDARTETPAAAEAKKSAFKLEPVTDPHILRQVPGAMYLGVKGSIRAMENGRPVIKHDQPLWLSGDAARGLERAQQILDQQGKGKQIQLRDLNSTGRLHDAQVAIAKAMPNQVHARPGHSAHEVGKSVDIHNYADRDVANALLKAGFRFGNHGKPIPNDPVHFTYHGPQSDTHVVSNRRHRR